MYRNPSFLNQNKPLLTNMIQARTPHECIVTARNAVYDGADAFGLQLEKLLPEYANRETYRSIYNAMGARPIYITSYRNHANEGKSDEECMEKLLEGLEAGATLGDVMGDIYCRTEGELTYDRDAVVRQKDLIDKIHNMGKEVLMSSHVHKFRTAEQVLEIALAHQERGADISKIVTGALSEEEEIENLRITNLLKKELKIPFLFLSNGTHNKLHRIVGPMMGCCMCLCVQQHDLLSTKSQPVLKAAKMVLENADF